MTQQTNKASGIVRQHLVLAAALMLAAVCMPSMASAQGSLEDDWRALVELYKATGGANWTENSNWSTSADSPPNAYDLNDWYGVTVDMEEERVSHLRLLENNLEGHIPAEIGNLTKLKRLDVHTNKLAGEIPPELWNLTELTWLDLGSNSGLTGEIPPEVGNLTDLKILGMNNSLVYGEVPMEIGNLTKLEHVGIERNQLTGMLPHSMTNLARLKYFAFHGQELCAPRSEDFQAWLMDIERVLGPNCANVLLTPPGNFLVTARVRSALRVSWEAPDYDGSETLRYTLQYRLTDIDDAEGGNQPGAWTPSVSYDGVSTDAIITGLKATTSYDVRVAAVTDGTGAFATLTISTLSLNFGGYVENQVYTVGETIVGLTMPAGSAGVGPYSYAFSPTLPAGLAFNRIALKVSGTPTEVFPSTVLTYSATDLNGLTGEQQFTIQVNPSNRVGVQLIHNVAGLEADVYLDDVLLYDDWAFQSATGFSELVRSSHRLDIVDAAGVDNSSPLASLEFDFEGGTSSQIIAYGNAEDARLVAVEDVRLGGDGSRAVSFRIAHGAKDAGPVALRLLDPDVTNAMHAVLEENIGFGDIGDYHVTEPRTFNVEVAMAGGGSVIDVYSFDFQGLEDQVLTLGLSGSGTNAAEGLTLMGVLPSGDVRFPEAVVTASEPGEALPEAFALRGNYPNPFNPSTRIVFDVPSAARVTVEVVDMLGRVVQAVSGQEFEAGVKHSIGITSQGLATGTYLYRLTAIMEQETVARTGRMTLAR